MELDFDFDPRPKPTPLPAREDPPATVVAQVPASQPPRRSNALTIVLLITTVVFAGLWLRGVWPSGGDGEKGEDIGGKVVAIFYDEKQMTGLTAAQREVVSGQDIAAWLDANADDWKLIEKQQLDDLSALPKAFQTLAAHHKSSLPWVIAGKGERFISEPVESPDQAIGAIKRLFDK